MALAAVGVLLLAGAAVFYLLGQGGRADTAYLKALRSQGLGGQYSSDANAVAAGRSFCQQLKGGEEPSGWPEDKVAVHYYCPDFERGFHVLREITVEGSLTLVDTSSSIYSSGIASDGSGNCTGAGGYEDIYPGANVVLKNGEGNTLVTVPLGAGSGTTVQCVFTFSLPVKEGEDDYVLDISDRGDQHYTFTELEQQPPELTLGD